MYIEQTFCIYKGGEFMKNNEKDKRLLKMVNEKNIDEIIKFIEDFLHKLQ